MRNIKKKKRNITYLWGVPCFPCGRARAWSNKGTVTQLIEYNIILRRRERQESKKFMIWFNRYIIFFINSEYLRAVEELRLISNGRTVYE